MKHILIVVDVQRDFISGPLGSEEGRAALPRIAERIASHDGPVFVTYDTHEKDYLLSREGKYLPVPHCVKGTAGWELEDAVASVLSGRNYTAVEKPTFGSVLLPALVSEEVGDEPFSITLIGVCTDICVVSNALLLKAHFPETDVFVDAACCAGVTPASHDAALATMRSCQITVLNG